MIKSPRKRVFYVLIVVVLVYLVVAYVIPYSISGHFYSNSETLKTYYFSPFRAMDSLPSMCDGMVLKINNAHHCIGYQFNEIHVDVFPDIYY